MFGQKKLQRRVKEALELHHQDMWRFSLALSGRRDLADDLTQATCVRALEKAHTLTHDTAIRGWLFTLCRRIWLNELRRNALRHTEPLQDDTISTLEGNFRGAESNIFLSQVLKEVMALPDAQRETVVLVYVLGYRYAQAAELMGVPIGTVMSRLSAARAKLAPLADTSGQIIKLASRRDAKTGK